MWPSAAIRRVGVSDVLGVSFLELLYDAQTERQGALQPPLVSSVVDLRTWLDTGGTSDGRGEEREQQENKNKRKYID